jgi:hypothetical protein
MYVYIKQFRPSNCLGQSSLSSALLGEGREGGTHPVMLAAGGGDLHA